MKPQTERTRQAWANTIATIVAYQEQHGYSPSLRDLATLRGVSSIAGIYYGLLRMADNGLVVLDRGVARSLRVTELGRQFLQTEQKA